MRPEPFALERYFARFEFSARYLLSSSDCDGWPQAEILALADDRTRALWEDLRLGYTESRGLPLLREEIARLYEGVRPEDVLVAVPEEAIFLAMNCILDPGDHIVCTHPGYQSLYAVAEGIGCSVDRWQPDESAGWRFDVGVLESKLRPETKLIVVNFPHNPTGSLPSRGDFRRIVELAREKDIFVFSDEMYRLLELDPLDRLPSACELYDKGLALSGMSKAFGMAGARVGWLVCKDRSLYDRLARFKDYTTICASAPSEILALIALRAQEAILDRHRRRISRNLDLLGAFFMKHSGRFCWVRPRAGTVGFPRLLEARRPDVFCEVVLERTGIMLLPSTVYDYDPPHVRIGFGRENMPEALARLDEFLES